MMVNWMVSTPEITLNRGAGPGGDTGAEEVLIFCPDSAFQLQALRQGGPVFGITDAGQCFVPGVGEPFIIDNLHNGQQTLESFLANNFIETPPAGEVEDIATGLRESRLSHKEIGLIGMVGEDQSHPPAEATTNQDVGVQNQTLAFHLQGSIVLVSSLPLSPALEVGLESLLIQADPLQFRLHAAASLKQPLSLIHAAVVRERHIEANRAAMAGDLDWGGGFEMGGEPGPKLPNADTGCHAIQRELCTHIRAFRVRWVRNRGGEVASL